MTNKKHQQRTKGNVKPSSSGRSSQLLMEAGITNVGAFSFSSLDESAIDSEIRAVFDRLGKKDATTKLKALQKLHDICSDELRANDVKVALPFWPRHFAKLATDNDRRVRECSQIAHQGVIEAVGKDLQKIYKTIAGVWFVSQSDPYAPAATSAVLSFQTAFPDHKEKDALIYAQKEILDHIQDLLLVQTEKTLSDIKTATPEEIEQRYERMIVAALTAYASLLERLSSDQLEKCSQQHKAIFQDPKFWKINKHSSPKIQHAWFTLLSSLCEHSLPLASHVASKIVPSVFLSLDAEDPTVLPGVWTSALFIIKNIDDPWSHINVQKSGVLNKLKKLAKEGCYGCAMQVMPSLVVFMNRIPLGLLGQPQMALDELCASIRESFGIRRVQLSPSEVCALITALVDLLHLAVKTYHADQDYCRSLLETHLLSILKESVLAKPSFLSNSPFANCVADKLEVWEKRRNEYQHVLELFWTAVSELCQNILNSHLVDESRAESEIRPEMPDFGAPHAIERMADFLCALHSPEKYKRRRSAGKVRFKTNSGGGHPLEPHHSHKHGYGAELAKIVANLCKSAISFSRENKSKSLVKFLSLILRDFASSSLFRDIYSSEENGTALFLKGFCLPILRENHVEGELLFLNVLFVLNEEERLSVLQDIVKTGPQTTILLIVKTVLDGHQSDDAINRWLCSEEVSRLLVLVAESVTSLRSTLEMTNEEQWELIRGTLTSPEEGCCILNPSVICNILEKFTDCLSDSQKITDITFLQSFLTSLASAIEHSVSFWSSLESADNFLTAVLRIVCNPRYGIDTSAKGQLLSIWSMSLENGDESRYKAAIVLMKDIVSGTIWNVDQLNEIVSTYDYIVGCLVEHWAVDSDDCLCLLGRMKSLFELIFSPSDLTSVFSDTAFLRTALSGYLRIDKVDENGVNLAPIQDAYVTASLLKKYAKLEPKEPPPATREEIMKTRFVSDCDDGSSSDTEKQEIIQEEKYDLSNFEHVFQRIQLAQAYASLIHEQYKGLSHSIEHLETVAILRDLLGKLVDQLFKNLEQIQQRRIFSYTLNDSRVQGYIYTLSLEKLLGVIGRLNDLEVNLKDLVDLVEIDGLGDLHTYQMLVTTSARKYAKDVLFQCSGSVAEMGLRHSANYLALLVSCLEQLGGEDGTVEALNVVTELVEKQASEDKGALLANCDLTSISQEKVSFTTGLIQFYSCLFRKFPHSLQQYHTPLSCLMGWTSSLKSTFGKYLSRKDPDAIPVHVLQFAAATASLFGAANHFMEQVRTNPDVAKLAPSTLANDWSDIYRNAVCDPLWPLLLELLNMNDSSASVKIELFISSISSHIILIPADKLVVKQPRPNSNPGLVTLKKLLPPLVSKKRGSQITAYLLAKKLIPGIVSHDEAHPIELPDGTENNARPLASFFVSFLKDLADDVRTAIGPARVGDPLSVPTSALHSLEAYILSWELILDQCAAATSELRSQYAQFLQDSGLLKDFLNLLFFMIPQRVLPEREVGGVKTATFVVDELKLDVFEPFTVMEIEHAASRVFSHALRQLPAAVRQWYTSADKNLSGFVERFTTRYVSAVICAEEMKSVQTANTTFTNMTIRVRPTVREVVAAYTIDDASMELIVKLPPHHPLGQIVVEGGKKVGIAQAQWRNWMLQLTTFLIHQNGSIYDGLLLWKRNVDKRFEGLEECYICYYILHGSNYQLPKLQCRTCKKKFHADCLYKWFNTSNNSTCPLCRNLF